ncbi:MAG: sensor histidine kinase [Bacteroidia bacterium]|nr:sensor histidine kinase [Bacteroidia bacterium]
MQEWWLTLIISLAYAEGTSLKIPQEPVRLQAAMYQEASAAATSIWMDSSLTEDPAAALSQLRKGTFLPLTEFDPGPISWQTWGATNTWLATAIENPTDTVYPLLIRTPGILRAGYMGVLVSVVPRLVQIPTYPIPDTSGYIHFWLRLEQVVMVPPCTRDTILVPMFFYSRPGHITLRLSDARTYESQRIRASLGQALFFLISCGLLLMMVLYALFNYIQLREEMFLWYMLYCAAILVVCWRNVEVHFPYVYLTYCHVRWIDTKTYLFAAMLLGYTRFVNTFLQGDIPILRRMAQGITYAVIALVVLETGLLMAHAEAASRLLYTLSTGLSGLVGLLVVFVLLRREDTLSRYILIGTLCLLAGEMMTWLFQDGWMSEAGALGVLLESACFTAGLAYRSSIWKTESLRAAYENQELQLQRALETERTRTRISQDIHDEVGSMMTRLIMGLELGLLDPDQVPSTLQKRIVQALADARSATASLREVIHSVKHGAGQITTLQADLQDRAYEFWQDAPVELRFYRLPLISHAELSPEVSWHILMISREAQSNIAKYAAATSVSLTFGEVVPGQFLLEIQDNGRGFDPTKVRDDAYGLSGMKWRADRIGAQLTITTAPGAGTRIRVTGPIQGTLSPRS